MAKGYNRAGKGQFTTRQYKKAQLLEQLKEYGILTAGGNKNEVQKLAQEISLLPIKETKSKIIYGWKWVYQHPELSHNTMNGKQGPFGLGSAQPKNMY